MQLRDDVKVVRPKPQSRTMITYTKPSQVKPPSKPKDGISICLSAWQTQDYIEECLDSIEAQTYFRGFNDYEVLLGIDGCEKTLEKVESIQYKYRNLRVFMMEKNVGTYITTNTVMSLAKYDWVLRFDSDDVMMPNMIERLMNGKKDADFVRFNMKNFSDGGFSASNGVAQAEGQMCFKKKIFDTYGGYQPWLCGADSEFITRLKPKIKFVKINEVLMRRRIHPNGLTSKKDTGYHSEIRKKYKEYIQEKSKTTPVIETVTAEYRELPFYKVYVNFTTYPLREWSAVKMLEHFKQQTLKPDKIICWLATDEYKGQNTPESLKPFVLEGLIEVRWVKQNSYGFKRYNIFKENTDYTYNIFIDDDILYDPDYVMDMYAAARKYKTFPICYYGFNFDYKGTDVVINKSNIGEPTYTNGYLSGFACMPPKVFPVEMFNYENERQEVNPKSDDDWINAWLLKSDKKTVVLHDRKDGEWKSIDGTRKDGLFTTYNSQKVEGVRNRIANFAKSCVFCGVEDKVYRLWPKFDIEKACQGLYQKVKKIQITDGKQN